MNFLSFMRGEKEIPRRFLHITTQGTNLTQSGQRLAVRKNKEVLMDIPVLKLHGIVLYGDAGHGRRPELCGSARTKAWR